MRDTISLSSSSFVDCLLLDSSFLQSFARILSFSTSWRVSGPLLCAIVLPKYIPRRLTSFRRLADKSSGCSFVGVGAVERFRIRLLLTVTAERFCNLQAEDFQTLLILLLLPPNERSD